MNWIVKRVLHFTKEQKIIDGYCHFGFHDQDGHHYALDHDQHWIGGFHIGRQDLNWTAGKVAPLDKARHIYIDLHNPTYVSPLDKDTVVAVSSGNNKVFRINHVTGKAELLIDGEKWGLKDIGNCELDPYGFLWVNEITGCRIRKFDLKGNLIATLGNGEPGPLTKKASYDEVQFNWIYDMRRGVDGNIYVLDSRNYCVRMIDPLKEEVTLIAGTGKSGYSGDGGPAIDATFGSGKEEQFDGPWSLLVDERGNIYIGDTQNHVIRMIDRETGYISTIAGTNEIRSRVNDSPKTTNPLYLQMPRICSLDYYNGTLFIPEWNGGLYVLERIK